MSLEKPRTKKLKIEDVEEENEESAAAMRNDDGESYFKLSDKRRLTVRKYKGKALIDIREFYDKDGKLLPGKKGISLTLEQYEMMRDAIIAGDVDKEIDQLEK